MSDKKQPKKNLWDFPRLDTDNKEPTGKSYIEVLCYADPNMFTEEWETTTSDADREILEVQKGLPCDGGGRPGGWCRTCYWGELELLDDDVEIC